MRSLTASEIATFAALITLFSVFGLALAVQSQLVNTTNEPRIPGPVRVKELDWMFGLLVCFPVVLTMPAVLYADRAWVGALMAAVVFSAIFFTVYMRLQRATRAATERSQRKDDKELEEAGFVRERLRVKFADLQVGTLIFRGDQGSFLDPRRALELAKDTASTRSFQEGEGIDPDVLPEIRSRLGLRPHLEICMPAGSGKERRRRATPLVKVALPGGRRRKLFRLGNPENDLLRLLRAGSTEHVPSD